MTARAYPEWVVTESERQMHDDFRKFLWFIWKQLSLPPPTPVQYDIAVYIQTGQRRRMVEAFRGLGKSWITAAYVLWLLYRDPNERILVVSAGESRAVAFSVFVKRLITDIDMLRFLEPRGDRTSVQAFDVGPAAADQAPSVRSLGITGQLTGGRASTIIADDIEIPKNSATEHQREKLAEQIKEFDALLKPGGQVIYLGTPQTAQTIYGRLPERGYDIRVWPARYPEKADAYEGRLAPMLAQALESGQVKSGQPTDTRFDDLDLMEREASYGRSGFALQFMLDTSLNDANRYPLKTRDLIVMDVDRELAPVQLTWASSPELALELPNVGLNGDRYFRPMYIAKDHIPYQGKVMFVDPSGRGRDETAYCVTYMLKGMIYVRRWGGLSGGYDDTTLEALARIAKEEGVNAIHLEENFGDGMFRALFEPVLAGIYPCSIVDYRVSGQKEARILDKLEPILNQHRLVMDKTVIEKDVALAQAEPVGTVPALYYSGLYQLTHLTRDRGSLRQDDRVDVLAEAVGYWVDSVANEVKKAEQEHKEKLMEEEIRKHIALTNSWKSAKRHTGLLGGRDGLAAGLMPRKPKRRLH